jgi:MFS family permease
LSDLFGRKNIGMAAFVLIIIGNVVCATAPSMNVFIIGSVLMGIGAGLGELISLAVTGEIAPTKNRGIYIGGMIMTILPFCPAVLYAQLVTYAATVSGLTDLTAARTRHC